MLPLNIVSGYDQLISPDCQDLNYSGRIDFSDPFIPCFIYAGSSIHFRFRGTTLKIIVRNQHLYWNNYLGYMIDNNLQGKIQFEQTDQVSVLLIAEHLEDTEHDVIIFKRQDSAHYFNFLGIILNKDAILLPAPIRPDRRIECYGDSISAGELVEAIQYVGKPDPEHNGEYSNAWYSYVAITARKLGAELHNNSQGGIALLDGTGYFHGPDYVGLESTYDKLRYNTQLGDYSGWDFCLYTPQVVIVAVGQNDAHPDNYMGKDPIKTEQWIEKYQALITTLRAKYTNALIILKTTILNHDKEWDDAIEKVTLQLMDPKIVHFLYSNNGCGTPGHVRIPEAEQMAAELTTFIAQFGEDIWK